LALVLVKWLLFRFTSAAQQADAGNSRKRTDFREFILHRLFFGCRRLRLICAVGQPGGAFGFSFGFRPPGGDGSAGLLARAGFTCARASLATKPTERLSGLVHRGHPHLFAQSQPILLMAAQRRFGGSPIRALKI
jgi:hypothetical protein